nr:hypothetical protein BaRGS_019180 [Batillaria attramentaria]
MHHVITSPAPVERKEFSLDQSGPRSPPILHRVRSMSPPPKEQDETEDQMKQIKTLSSRLHEAVAEREGALLAGCTRRRHEAVTCIYSLISDAQAQMLELDILDEKFGQLLLKASAMDISQELSCLEER